MDILHPSFPASLAPRPQTGVTTRRDFLRWNLSCATLFSATPHALVWAQTQDGPQLLRLPKLALVIGNARYRTAPLKNPVNDARAIGQALVELGFEVTVRLDATKAELDDALAVHVAQLAKRKCVGLIYYAGHGIQSSWKNYLLAVDVGLDSLADVIKGSADLNGLVAGLNKAANPMNVIVLDACRDNPFGEGKGMEQKGLSQMDAPPGTFLAYATAPGNTASDGEGANGLYTESLLREIRVTETKIEDVFKRVRLTVRRRSKGAQIPWESTSLEEDFYFLPPQSIAAQLEQLAKEEAQAREEAKALEEARAREEARLRAEAQARQQAEARARAEREKAEAAAREMARAQGEAKAREAERLLEETRARDEARARADAKAREEAEARAREQRSREETLARERERLAREATALQAREAARIAARAQDDVKAREAARASAFAEELRLWESIQTSTSPEPLEDYLRRYPSGQFSELAQLQLDRTLARQGEKPVQIASSQGNPYTKGSARTDTAYKLGDTFSYRLVDMASGNETSRPTLTVTQITDSEVIFNNGVVTTDLLGNTTRFADGRRPSGNQTVPTLFEVGRRWTTRFRLATPDSRIFENEVLFHIHAKETIVVPAGSFDCFRYEGIGVGRGPGQRFQNIQVNLVFRVWMAPELCRRAIKMETVRQVLGGPLLDNERRELLSFKQS